MKAQVPAVADMYRAAAVTLRPPEPLSPSAWAARHRRLKPGTTERPGPWSNEHYQYLVPIMNAIEEALDAGKRGVVIMKSGQCGVSEAMINVLGWLRDRFDGPILYLHAKDELAREFGRERLSYMVEHAAPLRAKALRTKADGDTIQVKRFTTGKVVLQGGKSVLNLQSTPYRVVMIDEVDSLLDEFAGQGDPIRIAEVRLDAFAGQTLLIAFGHPTTRDRGAGKLYYHLSDQRRGHVRCPHCAAWTWLDPAGLGPWPEGDETTDQARVRPERYRYAMRCCGAVLTDGERIEACREVRQLSTLEPEAAAAATWIGLHVSQLYAPHKTIEFLAARVIEATEDSAKRVVVNKRWGDTFDEASSESTIDGWRSCVATPRHDGDPRSYARGEVPPGVEYLTAGQDSRETELHWAVWGWGRVARLDGGAVLCGWLVDYGVVQRERRPTLDAADLAVLDQLVYERAFGAAGLRVRLGLHDSGWQPVGVYEFARRRKRAWPCKGGADDDRSTNAHLRWNAVPSYMVGTREVKDARLRLAVLNTHALRADLYGLVDQVIETEDGERPRIALPVDVGDDFLAQACASFLATVREGRKAWKHRGPDHWDDCNVYAYAGALNVARRPTADENESAEAQAPSARGSYAARDEQPADGRSGGRGDGWRIGR